MTRQKMRPPADRAAVAAQWQKHYPGSSARILVELALIAAMERARRTSYLWPPPGAEQPS